MSVTKAQLVGNVSTGASFAGIVTATSFSGNVTGNATGLSGSPNITVGVATVTTLKVGTGVTISSGVVTATEFDISGSSNTLTAGGLNVGVATASSVVVGSAVTVNSSGVNVTGVITATSLSVGGRTVSSLGVGINTSGGNVGYGATLLDFRGAGISTITVAAGIATINITGGSSGGASVSISTVAPSSPANGDLWYDSSVGNTYIWYNSQNVWVVSQSYGY